MSHTFVIHPAYAAVIRWNKRGSCGNAGCKDPECCCAFCGLPIGIPDEDPRWDEHSEFCDGCELCRDLIPLMLFRGEGKDTEQASFHARCFTRIAHIRTGIDKVMTSDAQNRTS